MGGSGGRVVIIARSLRTLTTRHTLQNHDWHTVANTTAELAYAVAKGRKTTRWNMPR